MSQNFYTPVLVNKMNRMKTAGKLLCLVLTILLLLPAAAFSRKYGRESWADTDHFWTVSYNTNEGAIHIKVLVYDDEFGPADEDGYVNRGKLSYTTDGTNYTEFYNINLNSGPSVDNSNGSLNGADVTYSETNSGRYKYWDFKLNISNGIKNISRIKFAGNWDVNGAYGSDDFDATRSVTVAQMSSLSFKSYSGQNYEWVTELENNVYVARAHVAYVTSLNDVDKVSKVTLYNGTGAAASRAFNLGINPPPFSVHNSVSDSNYYFKQTAYSDRLTQQTGTINVPAFTLPKTATASYNATTQTVSFTWTIDPVTTNNFVNDNFKLQVADNVDFTDAKDVTVTYDKTKSSYTYNVSSALSPQMYFRVARARPGFNWDLAKSANTTVSFTSIPLTATAALQNGKTALLTWNALNTAWLPGATFIITRINNTAKTQNEIKLNKSDFDKGTYTDVQIATCNSYNYTVQVVPPTASAFTAFAPVQIPNEILPTEIGSLINLEVSKGYFPDRTELRWSTSGAFDNFIIKRAVYGTTNFAQLSTVPGSTNSDYQTDDTKGTPGVYYTYQVIGVVKCNNVPVFSKETLTGIGFRSPTGNIYGRITYENGQAVEDVSVRLQSNDQAQLGKSIYLNGTASSYLKLDSTKAPFADTAFTIEAWIKPDDSNPVNQVIFSRKNQYALGFNAAGKLFFSYKGASVQGTYTNPANSFVHVTGIHTKDSLFIMLNNDVVGRVAVSYSTATGVDKPVYIGKSDAGQLFKGFIDEMRVYNIALPVAQVVQNQTRLLTGDETGLAAYWRFDETINDQFYDLAFHGDSYTQNDGAMNATAVTRSGTIPTTDQLSLKSFTDKSGNYFISGIPFIGNGTTYTIVPLKGTHQFDPISVNRLISPTSTQFTVDFKDKSSFPVSGYVYYKNTTVPVPGVQFKIDGQVAQQSNGAIFETDENGLFNISVPVGVHEVKAVKTDHVFANAGKITNRDGFNLNYQNNISGLKLTDSTTIRFIGRVAGGANQQKFPLGHSVSVNNLGKDISISMVLPSGNKYELNADPSVKTDTVKHLLPTNIKDSSKIHSTQVVYNTNSIVIKPDPITGEFVADLIPVKFIASTVNVTGWGDILDGKPVLLDFTNKFRVESSVRRYVDSALNKQNTYDKTNYYDSLTYNASYKFIKRKIPVVEILQATASGNALDYFGNETYKATALTGVQTDITLLDNTKTGYSKYLFNYPVFLQNQTYQFKIKASEQYPFYESVSNDGTPIVKQLNNKDVIDIVPTSDGEVSILNRIKNGSVAADVLSLSSVGTADYEFVAGDPNLAAGGIKTFSASVKFGPATNINWQYFGDPQLKGIVLGSKLTGTDFVTAGPDKVLMVLRDPPGANSYSYVEKGSTFSHTETYSGGVDQVGDVSITQKLGTELVTFTGVGVGTINTAAAQTGYTLGLHHEEHYKYENTIETSNTITTRFQTGAASVFVGAPADVFIGYSTNITYGQSNNVTIIPRADLKASDIPIYEPSPTSTYILVQRGGIHIGQQFSTLFAFPQQHIEKVLIPNLVSIRNTLLNPSTMTQASAMAIANNTKKPVYVSKLALTDPRFGKSNKDTVAFGPTAKNDLYWDGKSYKIYFPENDPYRTDTIMVINQYVTAWKSRMAENEKAKVNSTLEQNYSFHAGNPIEHSEQTGTNRDSTHSFNFIISGKVESSTDITINKAGFAFTLKEEIGTAQGGVFGGNANNSQTLGFVLSSPGTDDYYSVDVNKAPDSTFVFKTKGGVSGCPYAGQTVTTYYQPGTVLDQPTQRIEVPVLAVEKPVVNDIPSQRKASYNLLLRNESEARLPVTFVLGYVDNDSIKGATIAVDGSPIGGSGRAVVVQFGQTVTKVLTITKGPDAMDYNNIMILLRSNCQYDPTGYQENIADTVLLSAHFIPSCSDVNIKSPKDKWVLNSESPVNNSGKRYLPITINQFDVTNALFDHIELQYKPTASSTWIAAIKFYSNTTKFDAAQGEKLMITNAEAINYNFVLDDGSFNDQNYDVQAVSFCKVGTAFVTTESNLISGIKDTYNPRLFGTPQPADGVLSVNDDVRLNFNETIAAGLLTNADFQVTGIRNGVKGDHNVSVKLDGVGNYLATEFDKSFTGKNITAEMWVLPGKQADQTVFSHGDQNGSLELALTTDNKIQVTAGSTIVKSTNAYDYKPGEWAHVALVYNNISRTVSAFYNFVEMIHAAPVNAYIGTGHIEYGRSIKQQNSYFTGKLHEARIWEDTLTSIRLQVNSLNMLSGAENSLLAYYPMSEGKGTTVFDKAHGSHALLNGLWSTPEGKAIGLNGNGYVKMNTSFAPVVSAMDYTVELWFKADATQNNATLASNGKGDGTDFGGSLNLFSLGFEAGLLIFQNNGFKVQAIGNYLDNKWHHVAVAVNRNSGNAQLLVDGVLNQFFDAKNVGGIVAANTYLGVRTYFTADATTEPKFDRYFKGYIDEFRIWNTYLNQTLISKNNNVRLQGNELGLLAYYPFEIYEMFQGNNGLYYSLKDAKVQEQANTVVPPATGFNLLESNEAAPMKDRGPVDNLKFDFVVNNDALIINVQEPKQAIDKTIITFKSKNVRDLNGNKILSPVTWTAYIDQNQLKWSDNEINLVNEANAPLTFESRLVNNGGTSQHFTLSNLPSWLKATPSNGAVDPKGNQKIEFTVNTGLNIGSYEEIVFMRNDNNETEALKLTLQVKGQKPNWTVKPSDFQFNMGVYGKLRLNNIFSINKEDMLGAFINGKCVGVANNTRNASNDFWYVFLTVYSNDVKNNNVEFRIWQASTGKTFKATPSSNVSFANNAIVGTPSVPVIFDGSQLILQDMVIHENWNWISFNLLIPTNTPINTTLANGSWSSNDIIKNEGVSVFSTYTTNNGWLGTLTSINNLSLYKLNASKLQTLSLSGTPVSVTTTPIPLKGARWNYISYLPQFNTTVKEALAGYRALDEDVIKSQTGFAMYSAQNGWIGSLTFLEPGKGYMLYRKRTNDTAFYYPAIKGFLAGTTPRETNPNVYQRPVPGNFSNADNMTIAAVVAPGFEFRNGDSLLAFVNGELRGKSKPIINPEIKKNTYFFNIAGSAEQPVVFMIERGGEIIAQSTTMLTYRSNTIIGTLTKPLELHFEKQSGDVTIYPNPFNSSLNIAVDLRGLLPTGNRDVQVSVVDVAGRLVIKRAKQTVSGTGFNTTWNGRNADGNVCSKGVYFINITIDGIPHIYKVVKQ